MERLVSSGFLALPTVFITLCLAGALIALKWRRFGIALTLAASLCLFAAATPFMSSWLLRQAEAGLPRDVDFRGAQAIVVLGGEVRLGDAADTPDRLGPFALERLVLAAGAYRRLRLPVAVSGGRGPGAQVSEAALMKVALKTEFAVPVAWAEERSRTTWQNAVHTAEILRPVRATTVVLVSQAWHLPRALWAFERAGLTALPWPAPRTALRWQRAEDFLPNAGALQDSFHALHEIIGSFYYRLRY
jgi:uncharacterized SAM-binding protein YcdF (DUF218 family)